MKSSKRFQKFGRISLVSALLLSSNPLNATIASAETESPSKLIINEVYGGGGKVSKDGSVQAPFKNDFIELYNPTNEDISLDEFALTYTNNSGKTVQTFEFNENHVIKANDYFLLRGEATLGNEGDKGFGAVFEADVYFETPDAGIGMSDEKGNVELKKGEMVIDAVAYGELDTFKGEGTAITGVTLDKSARRINFTDSNNNSLDFEVVSPSPTMSGQVEGEVALVDLVKAPDIKSQAEYVSKQVALEIIPNTMELKKIAGFSTGLTDEDGGVAEIVKYNADNGKFYVINGKSQTIDIVSLNGLASETGQQLEKEKSINIADVVNTDTFQYGDLTGIDINTTLKTIVAAVQDVDYTKNGKIVVMDYDGEILKTYDAGVQPDMVKITADGKYILSADEAEPRQGLVNGIDPEGSVTVVEVETGKVTQVKFSDASVIANDVHIRNNGTKADAIKDLEPEYIALSEDGKKAYVSLQENNAIATIDVEAGKVVSVKSLGYKDHSLPGNELDAARNGKIEIERLPILGAYMPDSIAHVSIGGVDYLVTANEGDATEWEEFENVTDFKDVKDSITLNPDLFKGMNAVEVQAAFDHMKTSGEFDKLEVLTDRGNDAIYTLGGRSFSIWKADTMEIVYDSGSDFEKITAQRLPEVFNWSNDDDVFEKRSAKKGPEPEDVKIGMVDGEVFAFVGLERIGGMMTYNITNPANAQFANYMNSRDFTQALAGDVSPEGLEFVAAELSPTGRPLVLVGNEVSGTVSVNELQVAPVKVIQGVTLDQTKVSLKVGETVKLNASINPLDTTESKDLTWSSSDEVVAQVSTEGVVTALTAGNATITVQTKDGKHTATTAITATQIAPPVVEDEKNETPVTGSDTNKEDNKNGNKLPNTATNNYQILLLGATLISIGGVLYIVYRRKSTMLE